MEVIIVCHTEFGFVYKRRFVGDKNAVDGVKKGVRNLVDIADRYDAKVTFAVCPEVAEYFPKNVNHEIGLHIHPGWQEFEFQGIKFYVGDRYLKRHCKQSLNSTVLHDYPYEEQLEMIKTGKEYLTSVFGVEVKSFVAGRWSVNNDTIKALIEVGITHECSAVPHLKSDVYDWSKLPRICMPYHPSEDDYQRKGNLPILIVPVSRMIKGWVVDLEMVPTVGLSWLKACFKEYYSQNLPFFHICLHSPLMTESYFMDKMDKLLEFISKHKNIHFKFASEIKEYKETISKTKILPYVLGINRNIIIAFLKSKVLNR